MRAVATSMTFALNLETASTVLFGANSQDYLNMARVSAGSVLMGRADGRDDEKPQHPVYLDEFYLDRTKVTNTPFAEFHNAVGPRGGSDGREDLKRDRLRVTRAGGQDAGADEITTTQRGGQVSHNPGGGYHNISFRCAR